MAEFQPDEELSAIISDLWNADENRLQPGDDYEIDLQGYTNPWKEGSEDWAAHPLFSWVNEESLSGPTYKTFIALLDNYESETGLEEVVTEKEQLENWAFLDAIMETSVMKKAHSYLVERGCSPDDLEKFKEQLDDIWFKLYRRSRDSRDFDSSAFEHVFVGESRGKTSVLGMHNWIQFYLQEKRGNVDYKGYIRRGTPHDEIPRLLSIQFAWKDDVKPVGSTFVGVSPEFEVAMYTVAFLYRGPEDDDNIQISLGEDYQLDVVVHRFHGNTKLGTAYPMGR